MRMPIWVTDPQKNKEAKEAIAQGEQRVRRIYQEKAKEFGYETN